jgi:hypothetical protein
LLLVVAVAVLKEEILLVEVVALVVMFQAQVLLQVALHIL